MTSEFLFVTVNYYNILHVDAYPEVKQPFSHNIAAYWFLTVDTSS